jgi:hypothetical protein
MYKLFANKVCIDRLFYSVKLVEVENEIEVEVEVHIENEVKI